MLHHGINPNMARRCLQKELEQYRSAKNPKQKRSKRYVQLTDTQAAAALMQYAQTYALNAGSPQPLPPHSIFDFDVGGAIEWKHHR
jgi:hypothetical protein